MGRRRWDHDTPLSPFPFCAAPRGQLSTQRRVLICGGKCQSDEIPMPRLPAILFDVNWQFGYKCILMRWAKLSENDSRYKQRLVEQATVAGEWQINAVVRIHVVWLQTLRERSFVTGWDPKEGRNILMNSSVKRAFECYVTSENLNRVTKVWLKFKILK